jgi:hypothetical protein
LKKALAPSESAREQTIIDRYERAKKLDAPNINFETWQQEYLLAYLRAKEANIPDVSGDRAHWDLVKAIKQLDSGYAAIISTQITSAQLAQQPVRILPSIEDTLSAFAQHYRRTHIEKSNIHAGTFAATLNNEPSPYNRKRPRERDGKPIKPCLCGDLHFWGQCPYIDPTQRTSGFTKDPEKAKKIAEFEAKDEKGVLNQIREKNQRLKRQKKEASKDTNDLAIDNESDSIEIDAGDELPTHQYVAHAAHLSALPIYRTPPTPPFS